MRKITRLKIDHKLTFDSHIDEICKKAGQKMIVLSRIVAYINTENTFFISQGMDVSEPCENNKTNCLQKRSPRIIYNNETSFFKQLLEGDGSASIHTKNLLFRAAEIVKVLEGLAPKIKTEQ